MVMFAYVLGFVTGFICCIGISAVYVSAKRTPEPPERKPRCRCA